MAQHYRNQSGRPEQGRSGRYQTGGEHDRYRTGGEQRFSPDRNPREQSRGFEGDYSAGGYAEEFGYRRGHNRDDQDRDWRGGGYQSRSDSGSNYQNERDYGREGSRYDEGRFDEANRWSEGAGRRDVDDYYDRGNQGTSTSSWHEDAGDRGGYFGTGSYIDDGGASRGFGSDFERARSQVQQRYGGTTRGTSGSYSNYGRSQFGSQSGYGRGEYAGSEQPGRERPRGNYEGRSSWNYGQNREQQAGSGRTGRAYGYDPGAYRSDDTSYAGTQSHRGRGPQGYQRSDERLKEMICERLTDDPAIDASNITIEVTGQVVKLTGTVDDRSTKYEIEELVENFGGVKDIDNQLRVQSSRSGWSQSGQNTSGQQLRGGSDWEAGSSSLASAGTTTGRSTSGSTQSTASGSSSSTKRN